MYSKYYKLTSDVETRLAQTVQIVKMFREHALWLKTGQ